MAINSPTIAAGPTKQRIHVLDHRITIRFAAPGEIYFENVNGTLSGAYVSPPSRVGQVYFHQRKQNGTWFANMYVGIKFDTYGLLWVPLFTGDVLDSYTGNPYDPLFGHTGYDPILGG